MTSAFNVSTHHLRIYIGQKYISADTFVFKPNGAINKIDFINDFSLIAGDMIDLSDILTGFDPVTDLITDFVPITGNGANSLVLVDRDGTGSSYGFQQIATMQSITGLPDEGTLYANTTLIAV